MFNMAYWIDCFALGMLANAGAVFYMANGWAFSGVLEFSFLIIAALANVVATMHTMTCLIRRHVVCTPEVELDPLAYMKMTHIAIQNYLATVQYYLYMIDLDDVSAEATENKLLFAAHFDRLRILHNEHLKQETEIVYSEFQNRFPGHGRKFLDDHQDDLLMLGDWANLTSALIDDEVPIDVKRDALESLISELPPYFSHLIRHFTGEEENVDPIGKKYIPIELKKQLTRRVWQLTPADKWEIIIPFVLANLTRHEQRVQYLKSLFWSLPERTQQIGAIVYRNVDAIMWECLQADLREMIPRGLEGWRRYR